MALIMLLRRDATSLTEDEMAALTHAFEGDELEFVRCDPADFREHAVNCMKHKPDIVMLPLEKPIPSQAMEEGFRHVAIIDGKAMVLQPMVVDFKPLVP